MREYKKGLVCESQGYGIGAFAYYRGIVEDIISKLLDDIAELLAGDPNQRGHGKLAHIVRESLCFLVEQVIQAKQRAQEYASKMEILKKRLDQKGTTKTNAK